MLASFLLRGGSWNLDPRGYVRASSAFDGLATTSNIDEIYEYLSLIVRSCQSHSQLLMGDGSTVDRQLRVRGNPKRLQAILLSVVCVAWRGFDTAVSSKVLAKRVGERTNAS